MINKPDLDEPIKHRLKTQLIKVSIEIEEMLNKISNKEYCILCEFEQVQNQLSSVQKTAASYYLNSYLAPYTNAYQELSTAIQHLSERKQGGLIVVQRHDPLDFLLHSGVLIGGYVSHALLESIFYPGSALHDGAVLIRGDTIVSAGNVLPLSTQDMGGKKLGMRHRAAIGLSEKSDALVLVVSEETSRTSFALGGQLYPIHAGGLS